MQNRRGLLLSLLTGFVAVTFVAASAFADELIGILTKVDVEGKKVTVVEKGSDKEIEVKITDDTEYVTKKGPSKINLEKVEKQVEKAKEKGRKGISVKVTHDKGVASQIAPAGKKKAEPKTEN